VLIYSRIVSLDGYTADKVVYSASLSETSTARTRLERSFDADAIRALKLDGDVSIGGPTLAAHAIRAGLVDEYQLFVVPVIVGAACPLSRPGYGLPWTWSTNAASPAASSFCATARGPSHRYSP
jgi:dihydrofolate reductase